VRHAAFGIVACLDADGVVKPGPQPAVKLLLHPGFGQLRLFHEAAHHFIIRFLGHILRAFAAERMKGDERAIYCNAQLDAAGIRKYCNPDKAATELLGEAYERLGLSARGYDRIMRVARTIADMDASETIKANHIAEAIQYRSLDKKYWG